MISLQARGRDQRFATYAAPMSPARGPGRSRMRSATATFVFAAEPVQRGGGFLDIGDRMVLAELELQLDAVDREAEADDPRS